VAPFERRAQRLLALRRGAVAARGQQLQAVLHGRQQRLHTERRSTRCGQLDGERQTVDRPADRDHRRDIRIADREARVDRSGALREQRHRPVLQRLRCGHLPTGHGQRPEAEHAFRSEPQRYLARDDDAQTRRSLQQRLGEPSYGVDQMLGVVEREEQLQR
jgi:hypothetical protein